MAGVNFILGNTERTNSSVNKFPVNFRISNTIYGNSTIPTLLAQKIEFPNDSVSTSYTDNENMGGLIGGYYARQREPYNSITVNFLQTNKDIIDFIIRPWVLAVSHKGLIEDGETFIKTDIIANMYSKFSENNWALRKTVVFEGAVPVTVPGDVLNYESSDNSNIIKPCTFTYKRYYITDGSAANNVGSTDAGGSLAAEANAGRVVGASRTNVSDPRPTQPESTLLARPTSIPTSIPKPNTAIIIATPVSNSTTSQPVNAMGAPTNPPLGSRQLDTNNMQNLVNGASLPNTPPKLSLQEQQRQAIDNLNVKNFINGL